jgi:hypothetical protein
LRNQGAAGDIAGLLLYAGSAMMKTQNSALKPLRVPEEIPSRRE